VKLLLVCNAGNGCIAIGVGIVANGNSGNGNGNGQSGVAINGGHTHQGCTDAIGSSSTYC
jgi:hypothetical protein